MRLLSPEYLRFRMILLSTDGQYLMTLGNAMTCVLPAIDLQRDLRLGAQIQSYYQMHWAIQCEVVDIVPGFQDSGLIIGRLPSATSRAIPFPFRRRRVEDLKPTELSQQEATILLRLQKTGETGRGPFSRLDWLDQVRDWLSDALTIHPWDLRLVQHNVGPHRALVSVAVPSGECYWLKGGTGHDYRIVRILGEHEPRYVPQIIAYHPGLDIYLMEDAGTPLSIKQTITDKDVWRVSTRFARLQRRSSSVILSIREFSPCLQSTRDILSGLQRELPKALEALATGLPGKSHAVEPYRVLEMISELEQILHRLARMQLPEVLIHDDLHSGNILTKGEEILFIDWDESRLGTPFESVEYLSLLKPNERSFEPVLSAYANTWGAGLSRSMLKEAITLSKPLTIASRLLRGLRRGDDAAIHTSSLLTHSLRIMIRQLDHTLSEAVGARPRQSLYALPPKTLIRSRQM